MRVSAFAVLTSACLIAQISGKPDCAVDGTTVNAITGEPLTRVRVTVVHAGGRLSGATGISGKWGFSNVSCGSLQVIADRPGFLPGLYTGSPAQDLKIRLMPYARISGRVVDDQAEPVINTQVYTLVSDVREGRRTLLAGAFTDTNDLGEYRLPNLPAGKYIVCARASGALPVPSGTPTIYADKCYPDPVGPSTAVQITAGSETKIDFALDQVPPVHVRGFVSGLPEGTGVGVNLVRRNASQSFAADRSASARPDGMFDIAGVAPGSYLLKANRTDVTGHLTAHFPIDVGPAGVDSIALRLERATTLKVSLRIESRAGESPPKDHVRLVLRSLEPLIPSWPIECGDNNLTCTLTDVSPGDYKLGALSVPARFYVMSMTMAGEDIQGREFHLSSAPAPVEVVLRDDGGSMEGDVVDADGMPAPGTVMALQDGRAASISSRGHFQLQNLAPGDYKVYAWDDPTQVEYASPEWMQRYGGNGVAVTIMSGQSSHVKLTLQTVQQSHN